MLLPIKTIISLPVFTSGGVKLGKVIDANFDIDAHAIFQYIVAAGVVNKKTYLIRPIQVKSITAEKMVVDDAVLAQVAEQTSNNKLSSPALGNVSMINEK